MGAAMAKYGPPDLVTLRNVLVDSKQLSEAGGMEYISELHREGWAGAAIQFHAKIISEAENQRSAIVGAARVSRLAATEGIPEALEALGDLTREMDEFSRGEGVLRAIDPWEALTGEPEPIPWMIPGWFSEGERVLIGGEWSSGKSVIALDLAISMAHGGRFLNLIEVQGGPKRVLYCDEENGSALARLRMRQLMAGRKMTEDQAKAMPLRYLTKNALSFSTEKGQSDFRTEVNRFRPDVVVFDSVIRFFSGDNENDNSQWAQFISQHVMPYNSAGIAFVLLDHVRKPANGKGMNDSDIGQRIRGASDKPGSVDEMWCITGDRHSNKREMSHERTRWDEYQPTLQTSWSTSDDKQKAWIEAIPQKQGCEELIRSRVDAATTEGALRKDVQDYIKAAGFTVRAFELALASLYMKGVIVKANDTGKLVRLWNQTYAPQ